MKKYLIAIVFGLILNTHLEANAATQYLNLHPGYILKQSQEKSELEYRLRVLESQIQGDDPEYMINQLDYRISDLEQQRDTEKEYIMGVYGNNGIANQLEFKLPEIDAKYQNQINSLERQKDTYQAKITQEKKRQKELEDLKRKIIEEEAINETIEMDFANEYSDVSIEDTPVEDISEPIYEPEYETEDSPESEEIATKKKGFFSDIVVPTSSEEVIVKEEVPIQVVENKERFTEKVLNLFRRLLFWK